MCPPEAEKRPLRAALGKKHPAPHRGWLARPVPAARVPRSSARTLAYRLRSPLVSSPTAPARRCSGGWSVSAGGRAVRRSRARERRFWRVGGLAAAVAARTAVSRPAARARRSMVRNDGGAGKPHGAPFGDASVPVPGPRGHLSVQVSRAGPRARRAQPGRVLSGHTGLRPLSVQVLGDGTPSSEQGVGRAQPHHPGRRSEAEHPSGVAAVGGRGLEGDVGPAQC